MSSVTASGRGSHDKGSTQAKGQEPEILTVTGAGNLGHGGQQMTNPEREAESKVFTSRAVSSRRPCWHSADQPATLGAGSRTCTGKSEEPQVWGQEEQLFLRKRYTLHKQSHPLPRGTKASAVSHRGVSVSWAGGVLRSKPWPKQLCHGDLQTTTLMVLPGACQQQGSDVNVSGGTRSSEDVCPGAGTSHRISQRACETHWDGQGRPEILTSLILMDQTKKHHGKKDTVQLQEVKICHKALKVKFESALDKATAC